MTNDVEPLPPADFNLVGVYLCSIKGWQIHESGYNCLIFNL